MKLREFRKLIREEVRKVLNENASMYMPMVKKGDVSGLVNQVLSIDSVEDEQDDLKAMVAAAKTNPEFYAKFNALLSKKIKGIATSFDDDEEAPEWGPYEIKLMNKLGFNIK